MVAWRLEPTRRKKQCYEGEEKQVDLASSTMSVPVDRAHITILTDFSVIQLIQIAKFKTGTSRTPKISILAWW
jgi:hypothetical protein